MTFRFLTFALLSLALAACSSTPDLRPTAPMPGDNQVPTGDQGGHEKVGNPYIIAGKRYFPKHEPYYDSVGYASWYGPQFHGRKTANGETFNMNALTAAHKTLGLPSFVKVTNLENGRSVILRVNDRGPYVGDRLIDVSRRAAQMLGFAEKGLTQVRVQAVTESGQPYPKTNDRTADSRQPAIPSNPAQKSPYGEDMKIRTGDTAHYVQIGAYGDSSNAQREIQKAKDIGVDASVSKVSVGGQILHRVRIGPYQTRVIADRVMRKIVNFGFFEAKVLSEQVK